MGVNATFRDGVTVSDLVIGPDGAEATVAETRIRADAVVGADGANGTTARRAGIPVDIVHGVAYEGNAPYGVAPRERYANRAVIEIGVVPGGYAWVFPKGDHANVGVGGWGSQGSRMREHLRRLCSAHDIDADALTDVRGHRLPTRRLGSAAAKGRVLLVGDAAGLVDPLSGDGIYEAFVSAELASEAIESGRLEEYEASLSRALDHHAGASWSAKLALDRFPRTCFTVARIPKVWEVVTALLQGEVGHPSEARGLARPPLRLVAHMARRAGATSPR